MEKKPRLVVIAGPTASGKTDCAVEVCLRLGGEVVSADSMQIYAGMDIGTAKPDQAERRGVAHHMIDVAQPDEAWSAVRYREGALRAIEDIGARGRQPVLSGGTGLYIDAVTRPMGFARLGDAAMRAELGAIAEGPDGKARLHNMLDALDPEAAARLHPNDVFRVVRAIEINRLTGRTMGALAREDAAQKSAFDIRMYGLLWPRAALYERINRRVDAMIARGWPDEVARLMDKAPGSTAMHALGYREIAAALRGEMGLNEAAEKIKQATRNYAKRQMTWFKRDARVLWIDVCGRTVDDVAGEITEDVCHGRENI